MCLTADSGDGPVPPYVRGPMNQIKGERPCIWVEVAINRCDVDGVWLWLLTHLRLLRENPGSVVIDIQQVDLDGAGPTCFRFPCKMVMPM